MKCIRCGAEFNHPNTNVCGSCADDLRQEGEANRLAYESEKPTLAEALDQDIKHWPSERCKK